MDFLSDYVFRSVFTCTFMFLYYQFINLQILPHFHFSNAVVTVQNENRCIENAVITGVDNYGFLEAHLVDGTMITLQPDGNSFDMMEGLIYSKIH